MKHPLAGRSEMGPPIAPRGWIWRAGNRSTDNYFYSPDGKMFRSQVQLNTFLKSTPGMPSPSQFRWNFDASEFPNGELPGTPQPIHPRKRQRFDALKSQKRGMLSKTEVVDNSVLPTRVPGHEEIAPVIHDITIVPEYLLSPEKLLNDASHLPDVTLLDKIFVAKASDPEGFRKLPANALCKIYRLLRGEIAPPSFGVDELLKVCCSWACRHRRPWCLVEAARSTVLQCSAMRRDQQKLASLSLSDEKQAKSFLLVSGTCTRSICCSDDAYCLGCSCNICKENVETREKWSYLRCDACFHLAHLSCALEAKRAGVANEFGLDVQYCCFSCSKTSDLIPFWETRIKEAIGAKDMNVVEQQLLIAVKVMDGTSLSCYRFAHSRIKELLRELASHQECVDSDQVLQQVVESFNDCRRLRVYDEKYGNILAELLAENKETMNLKEELVKASELQRKAEEDYAEWLRAETMLLMRRQLLVEAEGDTTATRRSLAASKLQLKEALKRCELLSSLATSPEISTGLLELLQWNLGQEMFKMEAILCSTRSLKVANAKEYLSKLGSLMEEMKSQQKVVEGILAKLQQLHAMQRILDSRN